MIAKLYNGQKPLMIAGAVSFQFFLSMAVLSLIDPTQILGISRWIKPMKFFISIAIFLWTVGIYLFYLRGQQRFSRRISWGFIAIMTIEMAIITLQSARGTTSHFNNSTPLNDALFSIMGISIVTSTVLTAIILYKYFRADIELPRSIVWGMRLGLIVFLLGSIEGGYMSTQIGHTVGAADGGPGLPIVNWSTIAGDLRIAHFIGLHSLQAIPIAACLFERYRIAPVAGTAAFALIYFATFTALFAHALMGRPLIAGV